MKLSSVLLACFFTTPPPPPKKKKKKKKKLGIGLSSTKPLTFYNDTIIMEDIYKIGKLP